MVESLKLTNDLVTKKNQKLQEKNRQLKDQVDQKGDDESKSKHLISHMDKQINLSMGNERRFPGKQNLGTEVQHLKRAHQNGEILRKIVEKLT